MGDPQIEKIQGYMESLAELEKEFEAVDVELLRETALRMQPLFEKRNRITSDFPHFWAQVLEHAVDELNWTEHITSEDSVVLSALTQVNVTRPHAQHGDPRDLEITLAFADNKFTPAQTLTKVFRFQEAAPGDRYGSGVSLVSEPVEVRWKEGKDLTGGVNKAAIDAFRERRELGEKRRAETEKGKGKGKGSQNGDAKGKGKKEEDDEEDADAETAPEKGPAQKKLEQLLEKDSHQSFFNWFSYSGSHKEFGEMPDDSEPEVADETNAYFDGLLDPFPWADALAVQFAEDLYPGAVRYFTAALEAEGDEPSEDESIDIDESDAERELLKVAASSRKGSSSNNNNNNNNGSSKRKSGDDDDNSNGAKPTAKKSKKGD